MVRNRVRIRYRKQGDLRLIGHRDLVRAWERLFRRAGIRLSMSEGFHPKPRMNFPSALAVGVSGADEVLEAQLADAWTAGQVQSALEPHVPQGLAVTAVEQLPPEAPSGEAQRVTYELAVPAPWCDGLPQRVAAFLARGAHLVDRGQGRKPVDLGRFVQRIELVGGLLRMHIRVTRQGTARPREVLEALGLEDLEQQGLFLTRTAVELKP
jgi:radical SAM-linked protein